jgi:SAM-dependent methyltransferase
MSEDIVLEKQQQAKDIIKIFVDPFIDKLNKKTILDIGFGLGYNPLAMIEYGADVYGVEPARDEYKYATETLGLNKAKFLNIQLQDLPTTYDGCFDMITCFNFNIPINELDNLFEKVSLLLKDDGGFSISFADGIYDVLNHDSQLYAVMDILKRHFYDIGISVPGKNRLSNRIVLNCEKPVRIKNISENHTKK